MEFDSVLARRKMCRSFSEAPLSEQDREALYLAGTRGPSAGYSQGTEYLVLLDRGDIDDFWEIHSEATWREKNPDHEAVRAAPMIMIPLANPVAYLSRYSQADKSSSGLSRLENWPVPYWLTDAASSTMLILLKAVDLNLGALFFGIFRNEDRIRDRFLIPEHLDLLGALAIGHPKEASRPRSPSVVPKRSVASHYHFSTFPNLKGYSK